MRLRANSQLQLGIRGIRAEPTGFIVDFTGPVDRTRANFTISGYTRVRQGLYATADSGRHKLEIQSTVVSADAWRVQLKVAGWREGHVYELSCTPLGPNPDTPLCPAIGHYTLHRIPPM